MFSFEKAQVMENLILRTPTKIKTRHVAIANSTGPEMNQTHPKLQTLFNVQLLQFNSKLFQS